MIDIVKDVVELRKIEINDKEAKYLINLLKIFFRKYKVDLSPGNKNTLQLTSDDYAYDFFLDYYTPKYREDKIQIHLREKESNISLVRINIDANSFHANSDGEKIYGNRILIFSSEEWKGKNDGRTHTKAYPLPEIFSNTANLEQVFLDFLVYINVKKEGKITFPSLL